MYLLSGAAGAVCILASLFLVMELFGTPLIGSAEVDSLAYARIVFLALIALVSAVASIHFHRQSRRDPACLPSPRLRLVEGILFTLVGGILLAGGFLWLHISGGFMGLHLIGFMIGGGLLLQGLCRLGTRRGQTRKLNSESRSNPEK